MLTPQIPHWDQRPSPADYVGDTLPMVRNGKIEVFVSDGKGWVCLTDGTASDDAVQVSASRNLLPSDDGATLELSVPGVNLTIPQNLPKNFACAVIPKVSATVTPAPGVTVNGGTSPVNITEISSRLFAIQQRPSNASDYILPGV